MKKRRTSKRTLTLPEVPCVRPLDASSRQADTTASRTSLAPFGTVPSGTAPLTEREEGPKGCRVSRADAPLGDQRRDEPRRRHIEGQIERRTRLGNDAHGLDRACPCPAGHVSELDRRALLDRNIVTVIDRPVDGAAR